MKPEILIDKVAAARKGTGPKKLQIYIHVPFCSSKCLFCDWVDDIPVNQLKSGPAVRSSYVESLCRQIGFWGPSLTLMGYKPHCIYWGGGTPTRLQPEEFVKIQDALEASFDLDALVQHTLESTPNDLTPEKLASLEAIGVNRLSFGVQSFDADQLRRAGRGHSVEQALSSVQMAMNFSINDVNIDIISGFPGEDATTFKKTLKTAGELSPSHISVYSYRATPRTMMAMQINRGARSALELEEMIDSYEIAQHVLTEAGYQEYCFNYFAKDEKYKFISGLYGYELEGDIIGFGAGASSTLGGLSLRNDDVHLHEYIDNPLGFSQMQPFTLEKPEMLFPLFGGALMTKGGLSFSRFEYLTGISFQSAWRDPEIRAWFQYVENCGAELSYEKDRIVSARRDIHKVYLKNLSYTLNPALSEAV